MHTTYHISLYHKRVLLDVHFTEEKEYSLRHIKFSQHSIFQVNGPPDEKNPFFS